MDVLTVKLHIKYLALFAHALPLSVAPKQVTLFAKISNNKLQVVALYTHVKRTKTQRRCAGNETLVYGVVRTPSIHNVFDCVPIAKTIG